MAVLGSIRSFFLPTDSVDREIIVSAAPTTYSIRPLTIKHLDEVLRLNLRCFTNGDNYTKHTFEYLLNEPRTLSYRVVSAEGDIVGFAFALVNEQNAAHLTTIGIAPEHRHRGLARDLLFHLEQALRGRAVGTLVLEVRVSNEAALDLYRRAGFTAVQRIERYYNNGEDCFLMMKPLNTPAL